MKTEQIRSACPHDCPDGCALITTTRDGALVSVEGATDQELTDGWLCSKVRDYQRWVLNPERLRYPMRRTNPKHEVGRFERISWQEALDEIAGRWRALIDSVGAESILPYSYSGTLGLLQMSVASSRLWNRLGASGLRRSICGAAAETAVQATLGARYSPPPAQLRDARVIVLWGHNPASTAPHLMPHLRAAQRDGAKVVVIDPLRTLSCRSADWHLAPRPATDGALALGLARQWIKRGQIDTSFVSQSTVGFEAFRNAAEPFTVERVADITGIGVDDIKRLAEMLATARPALIKIADGLQRHENGGQTVRAIACLPALLGQYGIRGGGLAYSTSDYLRWDVEALSKASLCPAPPRTLEMNRLGAVLDGEDTPKTPIRSLFVFGANPACSSPNASRIKRAMQRDDLFTVVHELFITDTAELADILLPATSNLEQMDIHKAYGQPTLTFNEPAIAPIGEARSNWDVMRDLATALGFNEPWLQSDDASTLREIYETTRAGASPLRDVPFEQLRQQGHVSLVAEDFVPFADGLFPTPSGKVELLSEHLAETEGTAAVPDFHAPSEFAAPAPDALILISSATHHFVSSSFAGREDMRRKQGPVTIEIHPSDAAARSIENGDWVEVENRRGSIRLRATLTNNVRPGVVAVPKGFWAKHHPQQRNVNWLTSDRLGDVAGQSTFQSNRVWISASASSDQRDDAF